MPVNGTTPAVRLSTTLTDFDTVSNIVKGEAFIDTLGAAGSGLPMDAADGGFSTATENVYLDIPLTTVRQMTDGPHTLFVRGKDAAGNWGPAATTTLTVDKTGPAITGLTLTPNPTQGAPTVTLTANVVDALSSVSTVEWFVGSDPGVGNGTAVTPNAGGAITATIPVATLAEADHVVTVRARDSLGNTSSAAKPLQVRRPLWFSTAGNTNPPGVGGGTADDADIYSWSGTALSRALDLTAAPYLVPAAANVDGFSRVDATRFYLSFTSGVTLPGIAGTVQDEDVVLWTGTGWQLFFDGSVRGNMTTNVDAISVKGGVLYFSLSTSTAPPGVTGGGDDADIYSWAGGTTTTYSRVVDATNIGIPGNANVDGFVWASPTDWLFSFSDNADRAVTGLGSVQDEDVIRRTNGTWSVYFDGTSAAHGLTSNDLDVDAFDIP
jgi:hypothetical protein